MKTPLFSPFLLVAFLALLPHLEALAARKWHYTEVDGFKVYSDAAKGTTRRFVTELADARQTMSFLFPSMSKKPSIPLRVYIFDSDKSMDLVAPLYEGKPKRIGGLFFEDWEGPCMLIKVSNNTDFDRRIVFHEYIHYLISDPSYHLPVWLNEGLAEVFSTIESSKKGKVKVGNYIAHSVQTLRDEKLIPLERFFRVTRGSEEYNSRKHGQGVFYAQTWALVHFLLFGENGLPENSANRLVSRCVAGDYLDESIVQQELGIDYQELEKRLRKYMRNGKFTMRIYTLPEAGEDIELDLRQLSPPEVDLALGSLVLRLRGPADAYAYITRAFEAMPENPVVLAYRGYYALAQNRTGVAAERLKAATEAGSESAYSHLHYARARLMELNPKRDLRPNQLSKEETIDILTALFKARSLAGSFDKTLYHHIGETWLTSILTPKDTHMQALVEGMATYPDDERIALYLATYLLRAEQHDAANQLVSRFYPGELSGNMLQSFQALHQDLARATAVPDS